MGDTLILLARSLSLPGSGAAEATEPGLLTALGGRSESQELWAPVLSEAEGGPAQAPLLAVGPGVSLGRSPSSLLGAHLCVQFPGFMRTPVIRAWSSLPDGLLWTPPLCKDSVPKQGHLLKSWG